MIWITIIFLKHLTFQVLLSSVSYHYIWMYLGLFLQGFYSIMPDNERSLLFRWWIIFDFSRGFNFADDRFLQILPRFYFLVTKIMKRGWSFYIKIFTCWTALFYYLERKTHGKITNIIVIYFLLSFFIFQIIFLIRPRWEPKSAKIAKYSLCEY